MPATVKIENLYTDIRHYCKENASEDLLLKLQHYFKEPIVGYEMRAQQLWDKTKQVLKSNELSPDDAIDLVKFSFTNNMHEEITEDFLSRWKDSALRLTIRCACEKMTPEKRLLFRRS